MRTKGLMFIALFISGATFAQTATVKHEQQVKTNSSAGTKTAIHTSSETNAGSTSAVSADQVNAQANAAHKGKTEVTVDPSAVTAAKAAVKSNLEAGLETGIATGEVVKGHVESGLETGIATGNRLKEHTIKTGKAVRNAVQVNGAFNNSLKIKAAPVKLNTMTSGALRLGGL